MFLPDNILFTLCQTNSFNIFNINSSNRLLELSKSFSFKTQIKKFLFIPPVNAFLFLDNEGKLHLMLYNKNEKTELIPYLNINMLIKDVIYIKSYFIFIDNQCNFYYVYIDNMPLTKEQIEIMEKEKIAFIAIEKTFDDYTHLSIAENNLMLLSKNTNEVFYLTTNDLNKANMSTIGFKFIADKAFTNVHQFASGESHWLVLEKEYVPPLDKWTFNDVYKWFEEMKLEDYLNIIKYEKINGKDISEADETFFVNCMGMEEDDIKKVKYQITQVKHPTYKNVKLWGWGSNKQGQLGLTNFTTLFAKAPILITLPPLDDCLDSIDQIYCDDTCSVITSKFGQIFVTGNYNPKHKVFPLQNGNNNINNHNYNNSNAIGKDKKKKYHKTKQEKEKEKMKEMTVNHRWIDITKEVCFECMNNNEFIKIRKIFINKQGLFIFGYKLNEIPFNMIAKKPKFKHLKKGDKFITSDELIESIRSQKKDIVDKLTVVYTDTCLSLLEATLEEFLISEVPYHKIVQIKLISNIIWDRKKRYFQEDFFK